MPNPARPNPTKGQTMSSIWDEPSMKSSDDYVKFDAPGDTVTGRIISVRAHTFDDGKVAAQILLDTATGERTLSAGQMKLKAALAEQRPEAGDTLTVTFTKVEPRSGGKTLKHFDVTVIRAGVAPVAAATVVAGGVELSAEQVAALAAMGIPA